MFQFRRRKEKQESTVEKEVLMNLVGTHEALTQEFSEMKELQVQAAKDRETIILELKRLNDSLEKLSNN